MWAPGDLALCVDAAPRWPHREPLAINEGAEYVVRDVGIDDIDQMGLHLHGVTSAGWAGGYRADRFVKACGAVSEVRAHVAA